MHEMRYLAGPMETISRITRIFEPTRTVAPTGERMVCDVDDAFFATVNFASGALGQLTFTWAGHGPPTGLPDGRVIYGTRGCLKGDSLSLDDGSTHSASELFPREWRIWPFGGSSDVAWRRGTWSSQLNLGRSSIGTACTPSMSKCYSSPACSYDGIPARCAAASATEIREPHSAGMFEMLSTPMTGGTHHASRCQ